MNNSHTTLTREQKAELKIRVSQAVIKLPRNITTFFVHFFPEFDNDEGREILRNVISGRRVDEEITEKLEKLIELLKRAA